MPMIFYSVGSESSELAFSAWCRGWQPCFQLCPHSALSINLQFANRIQSLPGIMLARELRREQTNELPIMSRTVSEAPRPRREIVGVLGRFVAAVVSIRRNEGSLFDWHETAMRFESGMIGRRTRWKGNQRAKRSDKTVRQVECGSGTVQRTHEEIPGRLLGRWRAEATR